MLFKPGFLKAADGGGGGSFAFIGMQNENAGAAASTHDFTLAAGEKYALIVLGRNDTISSITTSNTDTVTLRGTGFSNVDSTGYSGRCADFTSSGSGTVTITLTMTSAGRRWIALWRLPSTDWDHVAEGLDTNAGGSPTDVDVDVNTNSGDIVLGAAALDSGDAGLTWSVPAGFDQIDDDSYDFLDGAFASAASAAGGTPEAFQLQNSGGFKNGGGLSAVYRA